MMEGSTELFGFIAFLGSIAVAIWGLWRQDHATGLWNNDYKEHPKGTPTRPFSEIKELTMMAIVLIGIGLILYIFTAIISRL